MLVLASGSPRRAALLRRLGLEPLVRPVDIDETPRPGETSAALVLRLAEAKARAAIERASARGVDDPALHGATCIVVLGGDTVVVHDGRIMGKPVDRDDFLRGFAALSGSAHRVCGGVAVLRWRRGAQHGLGTDGIERVGPETGGPETGVETIGIEIIGIERVDTEVRFGRVDEAAARAYWASGEPADKAGGYAIQGFGARFVTGIDGSYGNVVGLPLRRSARLLAAAGCDLSRADSAALAFDDRMPDASPPASPPDCP